MPATLTKDSLRMTQGIRQAARLRRGLGARFSAARVTRLRIRTRALADGTLVGRFVLDLPFDLI